LRLLRVLRILPGFGITVSSFADILPLLGQYITVLVGAFYLFAIIGMHAFGGDVLAQTNTALAGTAYAQSGFFNLNFDTLSSSFVVLFYLLALNDWPIIMEATVAVLGKSARLYFVAFWAVTIVLVLNVIVAFVIESFSAQKVKRETLHRMEAAVEAGKNSTSTNTSGGSSTSKAGVAGDWRALVVASGVDFSAWHLSRKAHHFDVYEELYGDDIRAAFPETFLS
jgi:hypothetical protein